MSSTGDVMSYLLTQRLLGGAMARRENYAAPGAHNISASQVQAANAVSIEAIAKQLSEQLSGLHEDVKKLQRGSYSPIRGSGVRVKDEGDYPPQVELTQRMMTMAEWEAQKEQHTTTKQKIEDSSASTSVSQQRGKKFKNTTEAVQWAARMREAKEEKKKLLTLLKSNPPPPQEATSSELKKDDVESTPAASVQQQTDSDKQAASKKPRRAGVGSTAGRDRCKTMGDAPPGSTS